MEALASTEKMLQDKVNKTSKVVMLILRNSPEQRKSAACHKIRLKHLILLQFKYQVSLSSAFIISVISAFFSICSQILGLWAC